MFCSKCGNQVPDGMKFCNRCGNPMGASVNGTPVNGMPVGGANMSPASGDDDNGDSRDGVKIVLIILIIVGLLAIVGVGAFAVKTFVLDNQIESSKDKDDKKDKDKKKSKKDKVDVEEVDAADVDDEDGTGGADATTTDADANDGASNGVAVASNPEEDEVGIHTYSFFIEDVSWNEAEELSKQKGGHLVRINSIEEWDYIVSQIEDLGYHQDVFYIGGKRDDTSNEYHWVANDGSLYDTTLNLNSAWCHELWMANEPSFNDTDGTIENCMMTFYREKDQRFVWNDSTAYVNELGVYTGKLGYIVEYE